MFWEKFMFWKKLKTKPEDKIGSKKSKIKREDKIGPLSSTGKRYLWVDTIEIVNNGDILIGTPKGMFRSQNCGKSWKKVSGEFMFPKIRKITTINDSLIFVSNFSDTNVGVIYRSIDSGINWERIDHQIIKDMRTNLKISNDTFAKGANQSLMVLTDQGTYYSADNGDSWKHENDSDMINGITYNSYNDSFYGYGDGIFQTSDNGANWIRIDNDILNGSLIDRFTSLVFCSNGMICAGSYYSGLYSSFDNGKNWNKSEYNEQICCLIVDKTDHVFAATYTDGILHSKDGKSWVVMDNLSPVISFALHPKGYLFGGNQLFGLSRYRL